MNALIDSRSMVSTQSLTGYRLLENQPELRSLANLGLEVSVATDHCYNTRVNVY